MAYAAVSKTVVFTDVRVQLPPSAFFNNIHTVDYYQLLVYTFNSYEKNIAHYLFNFNCHPVD